MSKWGAEHPRIVRALAVASLTAAYLIAMGVEPPAHKDTARDMLLGRDGTEFGIFDGCEAAFGGFRQGVLWPRLLALTMSLGLGPAGQHAIMAALLAASICLFDRTVLDHFGEDMGWTPTAMYLPLVVVAAGYPNLWNPILAPLPVALLLLALLQLATHGTIGAACASGVSLATAAEGHPASLLIAPVIVLLSLMSCQRPILALTLAALSGVVPSLAFSYTTWVFDGRALLQESWYIPLLAIALVFGLILANTFRRRWLALAVERRRRWLLLVMVGCVGSQAVAASILSGRILLSPQYYLTVLPALVILAGLVIRRMRREVDPGRFRIVMLNGIPAAFLSVPLAGAMVWRFGVSSGDASVPAYSMRESEILARHFWTSGYSFPDVQRHLRGPDSLLLFTAIAPFAPGPQTSVDRPMPDLRVLKFGDGHGPGKELPVGGDEVDLGRRRHAWVLPLDGWVGIAPSRLCFTSLERADASRCAEVSSSSIDFRGRYRDLAYPAFPGLHRALEEFRTMVPVSRMKVTWELPVVTRGEDAERYFDVAGVVGPAWVVGRVDGVGHRGELPSRHVVLDRTGATSGHIVLSTLAMTSDGPIRTGEDYPPDFLETRTDEAVLRESITRLPPLGHFMCTLLDTCP
jgi:hypothetical protein